MIAIQHRQRLRRMSHYQNLCRAPIILDESVAVATFDCDIILVIWYKTKTRWNRVYFPK